MTALRQLFRSLGGPSPAARPFSPATSDPLHRALAESRQRYKDLVEIASDFAWETDAHGRFAFVSPRGALGYAASALVGRRADELTWGGDAESAAHPFAAREPVENVRLWLRRADATAACVLVSALPLCDDAGAWRGARGVCRDVTEAQRRDAALARANIRDRLLAYILRAIRDTADPAGMLEAAAAATARAFGVVACRVWRAAPDGAMAAMTGDGATAAPPELLARVQAADEPVVQGPWLAVVCRHRGAVNGLVALQRDPGHPAWNDDDIALLARVADHLGIVIAQVADHERLQRLSRTDGLTGLLNRRTFHEELEQRWRRARHDGGGALVYCDLDNFKLVNDRAGHAAGDDALRRVADVLRGATRGLDLVARLGGDEFAVWLEGADRAGAERTAAAVLAGLAPLAALSRDADRPFAASLGIALAAAGDADLDAFLARADAAMYAAKRAGKGQAALAPEAAA